MAILGFEDMLALVQCNTMFPLTSRVVYHLNFSIIKGATMFINIFNVCIVIILFLLTGCASTSDLKPANEANEQAPRTPFVWGSFSESKGCIIFRENEKTEVGFYVIAFTWKKYRELEVIESIGYNLQPKIWVENQENKDRLHHLAIKDGLRYVKLMEDYTSEELKMARELCRKPILDIK